MTRRWFRNVIAYRAGLLKEIIPNIKDEVTVYGGYNVRFWQPYDGPMSVIVTCPDGLDWWTKL